MSSVKKIKSTQHQNFCIFCNGPGLSYQHVWPDWLKGILPRHHSTRSQMLMRFRHLSLNRALIVPSVESHQGNILALKFKKVCRECNGGWISRLEQNLKPLVSNLILAEEAIVKHDVMTDLAAWAAIVSIMAEFDDTKTQAIPKADVEYIFQHRRPPPHWKIMCGQYIGSRSAPTRYHHTSALAGNIHKINKIEHRKPNVQISIHILGKLIIYAASSTCHEFSIHTLEDNTTGGLAVIWPLPNTSHKWPPANSIDDTEVEFIAHVLPRSIT